MSETATPISSRVPPPKPRLRPARHRPIAVFQPLENRQLLTVFGPLLQFETWDQADPIGTSEIHYNEYCPIDPATGIRSVAGCGPIAEAQLLYYWQFPRSISFSSSDAYASYASVSSLMYIDDDASSLDFPTLATLNSRLSNITYSGDPAEQAMLAFGLGVKDQAYYSSDETGSYVGIDEFTALGFQSADDSSNWNLAKPTVISNIESGLPVLLTIRSSSGGHYVILDGYDDVADTFHTNFGWGGAADGWYSPPHFGTSYGFDTVSEVVYNLCPQLSAPTNLTASQGTSTGPIRLNWRASPIASGYEVWRNTTSNITTAKKIATLSGDAATFDDDTPPDGTTQYYYYWVRAISGRTVSSFTPSVRGFRRLVTVAIPDAALLTAIRISLNKSSGTITNLDLLTLQSLNAPAKGIQNLTGLEYATFLTSVDLSNNAITDAAPLANAHSITGLHLASNQISSASFLANMANLSLLTLDHNQISDLSPLSTLTKLSTLSLANNQISDLAPLANMWLLYNLSLDNNHISDISPLAATGAITLLSFSNNQVSDLTALARLRNLRQLTANNNLIADISPLASDTLLTTLSLKNNRVSDISPLASLSRLRQLDVSSNYLNISTGSPTLTLIAGILRQGATVTYTPQNMLPQALTATLPFTTVTYTLGKPANLALALKCPTAPARPYAGTATLLDATDACLASATVATNGKVTWSLASLSPGTYTCTVNFPGDANHLALQSNTFTLIILPASTKTTLKSSLAAPVFGQPFALTATVIPSSAPATPRTGTVTFFDGLTELGTVPLDANSQAVFPLTASLVGTNKYSATYNGDSNFNPSTARAVAVKIQKDTVVAQPLTGTNATVSVLVGQLFTLSTSFAVLAPGAGIPTGLVTFKDGSRILATVPLDATGAAQCTIALISAGKHKITAYYAGDANNKPATAAPVYQLATPASTTTTLTLTAPTDPTVLLTSAPAATPVTLTATVSRLDPSTGTPVGKVQFKDGTKILATLPLKNGTASFTTAKLLLGTHTLTATFLPSPTDLTSLTTTPLEIL